MINFKKVLETESKYWNKGLYTKSHNQHANHKLMEFGYKYIYYDSNNEQEWILVSNQSKVDKYNDSNLGIFSNESYTLSYLIPEYKMFNYILKIDGKLEEKDKILKIKNIPIVNMVSKINKSLIKNKDKLIF